MPLLSEIQALPPATSARLLYASDRLAYYVIDANVAGSLARPVLDTSSLVSQLVSLAGSLADLATQLGTLEADLESQLSTLETNLSTEIGDVETDVESQIGAVAANLTAVSNNVATLTTTVNNQAASITALQSSKANLSAPVFTGNPARNTDVAPGTNDNTLATAKFVAAAAADLSSQIAALQSSKANVAAPVFTGNPSRNTDLSLSAASNELATAKFVLAKISGLGSGTGTALAVVSAIEPVGAAEGTLWLSTTSLSLSVRYNGAWVDPSSVTSVNWLDIVGAPAFAPAVHNHPFSDAFYTSLAPGGIADTDRIYFGDLSSTKVITFGDLKDTLRDHFDALYWAIPPDIPENAYTSPSGEGYLDSENEYYTAPA
jgi:hypothetical protein